MCGFYTGNIRISNGMNLIKRVCCSNTKHSCHFCQCRFWLFVILVLLVIFLRRPSELSQCLCSDSSAEAHNLCYHLPENQSVFGKRFSCAHISQLQELNLLETKSDDGRSEQLADIVFVTAFSQNHYQEGRRLIASVRRYWKSAKVIVYDLGLSKRHKQKIQALCNVEYRMFPFDKYPAFFRDLTTFRWKPIVIAEVLGNFSAFWYLDSSVYFTSGHLEHVHSLLACERNKEFLPPPIAARDFREKKVKYELAWNAVKWSADVAECTKSRYLLHSFTGHGIAAATDPALYRYFPTNMQELQKEKAKMYEAGLVFIQRDTSVMEIVKWYVLCALEYHCMRSTLQPNYCRFGDDKYKTFAGCHRFDQSVINVLLANQYYSDRYYYTSGITDFFKIQRFVNRTVRGRELLC